MSYDRTLYVGWYITYTPSSLKVDDTPGSKSQCSKDPKHKQPGGKHLFCQHCGAPIETVSVPRQRGMKPMHHVLGESSPSEIAYSTLDRGTPQDIAALDEGLAIFPEFMPSDQRHVLMLPGYAKVEDVGRCDGFATEVDTSMNQEKTEAMLAYIELAKKVFDVRNTQLKFGIVMDVR